MKVKNCLSIFCSSTCHCAVSPDVTVRWLEESDTLHVQIWLTLLAARCGRPSVFTGNTEVRLQHRGSVSAKTQPKQEEALFPPVTIPR